MLHHFFPHRVVLLKEGAGERVLPIWIGPFEAELIRIQLAEVEMKRPLSYDLIKSLLDASDTVVKSATVSRLHEKLYFGELKIETNGQEKVVDCRPSDALTLATRINCPIFVAPEVMAAESTTLTQIQPNGKGSYQWERDGETHHFKTVLSS